MSARADYRRDYSTPGSMGHRTIRDQHGVEWQVWDTTPAKQVSRTLEGGWLTFESATEKRRLAPVPLYWLNAPDEELVRLLATANPVPKKSSTAFGREADR